MRSLPLHMLTRKIYLGLIIAGSAGLAYAWPIGLTITGLLIIVALSYYQTIHGYPSGGGSYIVRDPTSADAWFDRSCCASARLHP